MTSPFDYINSVTFSKKDIIQASDNPEVEEKAYPAFMINRGLSYFLDTVMYANEMNFYNNIGGKLQQDYLLNSIRPKKRFSKWAKKEIVADLELVMEHFGYNRQKAQTALKILSPKQIKEIRKNREQGGVT